MARRKQSEIGTARAHPGAPHNQAFQLNGRPNGKRFSWYRGYSKKPKSAD